MIRILAVLVALATGSASAASARQTVFDHPATAAQLSQTLAPLTGALREAHTLRGAFTQRKTLKDLPRPLVAEGTFLLVREHGIRWRTTTPFVSELVITREALVQRDGGDTRGLRLPAGSHPAVRALSEIFMAVFGLDFAALDQIFTLYGKPPKAAARNWVLGLRPREKALAAATQDIVLEGSAQVRRITLRDAQGDLTEITLHDTVASNTPPTPDELKLFAP